MTIKKNLFSLFLFIFILFIAGCGASVPANHHPASTDKTTENPQTQTTGELTVHFIDVGQGDAELLQLPNGQNMLIDAGTSDAGPTVVNYLTQHGVKKIDYLIGTHPHADHIGGMDQVIQSFDIGKIYMPKITANTQTFEDVLDAVKAKGLNITAGKAGMTVIDQNGLKINFLAPCGSAYEDLNNWSIVTKVQFEKTSFLFTGDAQAESENEMLHSGANLEADVLKVGHHGSSSSTSVSFLQAVAPSYAVISVGAGNDYGHPHQSTLNKLAAAKVTVYRTDINGTVVITSNGKKLSLKVSGHAIKPQGSNTGIISSTPLAANSSGYIGNRNSKKFHRPTCSSLPAPQNRIYFQTRAEAIAAGYTPCGRCNP